MQAWLSALLIAVASVAWAEGSQYLNYDEFIREVEAGNVRAVELNDFSAIRGTLGADDATHAFRSYARTGSANDPLLARFLEEHNVEVSIQDQAKPRHKMPVFMGVFLMAVPIVLVVLLIVIIRKLNEILANQKGPHSSNCQRS